MGIGSNYVGRDHQKAVSGYSEDSREDYLRKSLVELAHYSNREALARAGRQNKKAEHIVKLAGLVDHLGIETATYLVELINADLRKDFNVDTGRPY